MVDYPAEIRLRLPRYKANVKHREKLVVLLVILWLLDSAPCIYVLPFILFLPPLFLFLEGAEGERYIGQQSFGIFEFLSFLPILTSSYRDFAKRVNEFLSAYL